MYVSQIDTHVTNLCVFVDELFECSLRAFCVVSFYQQAQPSEAEAVLL